MKHTAVCSLLSFVMVLAAGACKRPPPDRGVAPPPSSPPPATSNPSESSAPPVAGIDPPAPPAEFRDAAQWLPQGEIAGWKQSGAVVRSTAGNLFQIIDGAAPSYEQYGLRNYAKTDYRKPGTALVATVEIYEFETPLGAFGRYTLMLANDRDPATMQPQSVARGGGGYQGSTQLSFWKGKYLVQTSVSDASDEPNEAALAVAARGALPSFGEVLERKVPGDATPPPSPLPQEGVVWGGVTYLAEGVLGAERTGSGWVGHYRSPDGKRYRLAILVRSTPEDATTAAARFRGARAATVPRLGDEAFAAASATQGELVVARKGNAVFVVADAGAPGLPALDRSGKIAVLRSTLAAPLATTAP